VELITVIGLVAATLTTSAFLPQTLKLLRSKKADDISLSMYLVFAAGIILWEIYGILLASPPLIFANGVSLIFAGSIIFLKLRYSKK